MFSRTSVRSQVEEVLVLPAEHDLARVTAAETLLAAARVPVPAVSREQFTVPEALGALGTSIHSATPLEVLIP